MESAIESGFSCTLGVARGGVAVLSVGFGSACRGLGNGRSVVCTVFRCFFCSCARVFVQHNKTQTNKQACFMSSVFDCPLCAWRWGRGGYVVARCARSSSFVEHLTKLPFSYCSLALSIRACNSGVIVYSSPSKGTRTKACFRPLRIITSSFIAKSKYFFWLARNSFVLIMCMVKFLV